MMRTDVRAEWNTRRQVPRLVLMALMVMMAFPFRSSQAGEPVYIAVMVGSSSYQGDDRLPDLRFADQDVVRFLRTVQPFLEANNVRLLLDPDEEAEASLAALGVSRWDEPTGSALEAAFAWLEERTQAVKHEGKEVRALVYFSAHGDVGGLHLRDGLFPGQRLQAELDKLSAETVLLVADACFSETWLQAKGSSDEQDKLSAEELFPPEGVAAAIQPLERVGAVTMQSLTREESALGLGGRLTHELTSALLGAADLDQDQKITYEELEAWLKVLDEARGVRSQEVVRAPRKPLERPAVLVDLKRLPLRGLLFPPNSSREDERYLVQDARGQMVAEFAKQGGERRRLYLPPGSYHVQRFSPPDAWFGQEGDLEVREGTTAVGLETLTGWWQWPDGKGLDPRAAPEEARRLSAEEVSYSTRSRFGRAATWRDLPGRLQGTVSVSSVSGGTTPAFIREAVGVSEGIPDLEASSLTRDGPTLGIVGALDRRVASLEAGYLLLGLGGGGLLSPRTSLGTIEGVPVIQLEAVGRLGLEREIRARTLRLIGYGGVLVAWPLGGVESEWDQAWSMPTGGLELALVLPARRGPGITFRLGPDVVLEPQNLGGGEMRLVPLFSVAGGVGLVWR